MLDLAEFDFNLLRIALAFGMLGIATAFDLKTREVHDIIWIIFGAIAGVLVLFQSDNIQLLTQLGLSLVMITPLSLILWRMGFFGGADAFALIVLSALAPFATIADTTVTPLTTILNAAILSLVILAINGARNLSSVLSGKNIFDGFDESGSKKIIACLIGTKAKNPKHGFSIEKDTDTGKKFDFRLHHAEDAQFCTTKNTWVTYGIPFMLYILAGFFVQVFFGDLIFSGFFDFFN